jgi:hypothetical protein
MSDKQSDKPDEVSIHSILSEIKSGAIDPETLPKPTRQLCVEILAFEGHQPSALAQLLKVSDKTIKRDLQEIHERNSVTPSPELAKQLVGECIQKTRMHYSYIVRLARGKEGTLTEKVQAEFLAWRTQKEFLQLMQSLGYLPLRPQEVVGNVVHHVSKESEIEALDEIRQTILAIEQTAKECGGISTEVQEKVEKLKLEVHKTELAEEALNLKTEVENEKKPERVVE